MKRKDKTIKAVGLLFLIAMFSSIAGGVLIESILNDNDLIRKVFVNKALIRFGVFLEIINSLAVIGIAILLFPVIKEFNERTALGYFSFRLIESLFCVTSAFMPLLVINLSDEYLKASVLNYSYFDSIGKSLLVVRSEISGLMIPIFFSLGGILFYTFLYQSKLIPGFISLWGLISVILVLSSNLFETSSTIQVLLVLPIIVNEIFLGGWLIVNGFKVNITMQND